MAGQARIRLLERLCRGRPHPAQRLARLRRPAG